MPAYKCSQVVSLSLIQATFITLLGATEDQTIPAKLGEAFHIVGNAIAVPHALLTVLFGLHAILPWQLDIQGLLRSCWQDRLTAHNAIIFQQDEWIHVIRHTSATNYLGAQPQQKQQGEIHIDIHLHSSGIRATGSFAPHSSAGKDPDHSCLTC